MGKLFETDGDVANEKFDKILDAIQNQDKAALKSMFSKKTLAEVNDMDEKIHELFDYFQGEFVSYDDWGGPSGGDEKNAGNHLKRVELTYDVETSEQKYQFAFQDITIDTADKENVGIHSLYVINVEEIPNEERRFAYWGDGQWTQGIHIGKNWAGN